MNRRWLWSVRWRSAAVWVWCSFCLLTLASLTLRYILLYIHPDHDTHRERWCPPEPVESDECFSWRPVLMPHATCGCKRRILIRHTCSEGLSPEMWDGLANSTCDPDGSVRGPQQLVMSISTPFLTPKHLATLSYTITQVSELYRGWVLRVYTRVNKHSLSSLCLLVCANPNLDVCDVTAMSETANTVHHAAWRWGVVGDPLVSTWALRYLHHALLPRDAHALTQFINSNKCWHLMKDHPTHSHRVLGSGILAGKTSWGLSELTDIRKRILLTSSVVEEEQVFRDMVTPVIGLDVMTHDSLTCYTSAGAVPFPSRRSPGQWVGMPIPPLTNSPQNQNKSHKNATDIMPPQLKIFSVKYNSKVNKTDGFQILKHQADKGGENGLEREQLNKKNGIPRCPHSCRPPLHPDWDYC